MSEKTDSMPVISFDKARIAVILGSTQDNMATNTYPNAKILRSDDVSSIEAMLSSGKCDVYLDEEIQAKVLLKKQKNFRILNDSLCVSEVGIGFNKEQKELCRQFNEFLKSIKDNGQLQEMTDRWSNDDGTEVLPKIDVPTEGIPLRVGTSGLQNVFTFVRGNELAGLDIELLTRFAAYIGRPVEFQKMSFAGLITGLVSGKVDILASAVNITPERRQNIDFSEPYFYSKTVAIVCVNNTAASGNNGMFKDIEDSFYENLIRHDRYKLIIEGLEITMYISVFSTIFGTLLAGVVCWMRMNRRKPLRVIASVYINLMRGMPILVFLMLLYYVVFSAWDVNASIVAVLAFAMNFAAYVSEMFRTSINGVDKGQTEAGIALGFTPVQTFCNIVLPQAARSVLPVYKGELISMIKMTSIVGYVAVEDLTKASDIIRSQTFDAFFPLVLVAIIYFVIAWLFTLLLDFIGGRGKRINEM
ncbi:MAG: ABC transporter substrate-binding protein/permease [Prevotellaceae bacterium]|nr:ABC transporter substrate-binding protein/permease [Prevotellaceae bacterium]